MSAVTTVFVTNADLIKRTIFARQMMPVATILSYGLHFCLETLVILLFIPIFPGAFKLTPALLLVPVFLLFLVLLLSGAALAVSVLNVIYRDVAYIVSTSLLLLYWLTPVFYPMDVIPFPYRTYLQCNPIAGILTGLRRAIMHGDSPSLLGWAGIVVPTLLMMLIGWRVYRHYEHMVLDFV
jgi:ABC-type polysaccharide/polyol phosphate export permease